MESQPLNSRSDLFTIEDAIGDEQPKECDTTSTSKHRLSIMTFLISACVVVLLLTISFSAVTSFINEPRRTTQCGASADDAVKLGCHFDIMSFSWLPTECYDEALVQEFQSMNQWQHFADPNGTQAVPMFEVQLGRADHLFVPFSYHRAHCVFMWKKLHRALSKGTLVDDYIGRYAHTAHCGGMLMMEGEGLSELNTMIRRKFPVCNSNQVHREY